VNAIRLAAGLLVATVLGFGIVSTRAGAQGGAPAAPAAPVVTTTWPTYGGNLASHRYSPADQITKDNFSKLQVAWR
jgi:quinoprotein glucose dehydrogenase